MKLGLREANQQFSKAIKAVRAGKEVVLTDRGHPFAVIKPLAQEKPEDVAIQQMAEEGLVRPAARQGPMPAATGVAARLKGRTMSQTVIEEREDRA